MWLLLLYLLYCVLHCTFFLSSLFLIFPCFLYSFFFLLLRLPPRSTLFPYTTLFRSTRGWTTRAPRRSSNQRSSHASESARVLSRSEEHTSELQSPDHLVCRLLLEKKKKKNQKNKINGACQDSMNATTRARTAAAT